MNKLDLPFDATQFAAVFKAVSEVPSSLNGAGINVSQDIGSRRRDNLRAL
jgi:hypothetical protein